MTAWRPRRCPTTMLMCPTTYGGRLVFIYNDEYRFSLFVILNCIMRCSYIVSTVHVMNNNNFTLQFLQWLHDAHFVWLFSVNYSMSATVFIFSNPWNYLIWSKFVFNVLFDVESLWWARLSRPGLLMFVSIIAFMRLKMEFVFNFLWKSLVFLFLI